VKIAFTGVSSTGKTTLARRLMKVPAFHSHVDTCVSDVARSIIEYLRLPPVDKMTRRQSQTFELCCFSYKLLQESALDRYLVDRSFVDVAAIWLERDARGMSLEVQNLIVDPCRSLSERYDFHCYFPRRVIPFVADSVRSTNLDYHRRVDEHIKSLLDHWGLEYITMTNAEIEVRALQVMEHITKRNSR
jgi:predicted ATPase